MDSHVQRDRYQVLMDNRSISDLMAFPEFLSPKQNEKLDLRKNGYDQLSVVVFCLYNMMEAGLVTKRWDSLFWSVMFLPLHLQIVNSDTKKKSALGGEV